MCKRKSDRHMQINSNGWKVYGKLRVQYTPVNFRLSFVDISSLFFSCSHTLFFSLSFYFHWETFLLLSEYCLLPLFWIYLYAKNGKGFPFCFVSFARSIVCLFVGFFSLFLLRCWFFLLFWFDFFFCVRKMKGKNSWNKIDINSSTPGVSLHTHTLDRFDFSCRFHTKYVFIWILFFSSCI